MEGDAFALFLGGGMAKPITPYSPHGEGQDMAEIALDELDAGKGFHASGIAVGAVFPGKGDARLVDGQDAGVADGAAANIGTEILDGAFAVAEALDMDSPVFFPNGGINSTHAGMFRQSAQVVEFLMEELPEGVSQHGLRDKEAWTFDAHYAASQIDPRTRHDAVDVGMEEQTLVPRVQDHGGAVFMSPEPAWVGKCLGESTGCRRKKELIDLSGSRGKEESPEFFGHREGDHEVGGSDPLAQFAFHPLRGGLFAALRAGAMVAGMIGELTGPAFGAGMDMPAHGRCAAMGERPDGATPRPSLHGMIPQEIGQKAAQRPDHGGGCQVARTFASPTGANRY